MQYLDVSYRNDETDENFELHKEIDSPFIYDWLNAMVDVLKLMGFGDNLIGEYLGETYFTRENKGDCAENCAKSVHIDSSALNIDEVVKRICKNFSNAISSI